MLMCHRRLFVVAAGVAFMGIASTLHGGFHRLAEETEVKDHVCFHIGEAEYQASATLEERFWSRAPVIRLPDAIGRISNRRNVVRIVHDDDMLHLAYSFRDLHALIDDTQLTAPGRGEAVEILNLRWSRNGETASHSIAAFSDMQVVPAEGASVASSPTPEFANGYYWVLEVGIPLSDLPEPGDDGRLVMEQVFATTGRSQRVAMEFSQRSPTPLKEKLLWSGASHMEAEDALRLAKDLGFNAIVGTRYIEHADAERMRVFASIGVSRGSGGRQAMLAEEERLRENPPPDQQYGGEPVDKQRGEEVFVFGAAEVLSSKGRSGARRRAAHAIDAGVDGLIFDYVGYNNYYADFSEPAQEAFGRHRNPSIDKQLASDRFFEAKLIEAYSDIAAFARAYAAENGRDLRMSAHIYPHFFPNPLYGNRLPLDSVGQTVSWFFEPHWDFEKVEAYTRHVVVEQDRYHPNAIGAPFIAISLGDGEGTGDPRHRKSPERVRREIEIVLDSGAEALHIAVIGRLNEHPEIQDVIRELLRN